MTWLIFYCTFCYLFGIGYYTQLSVNSKLPSILILIFWCTSPLSLIAILGGDIGNYFNRHK